MNSNSDDNGPIKDVFLSQYFALLNHRPEFYQTSFFMERQKLIPTIKKSKAKSIYSKGVSRRLKSLQQDSNFLSSWKNRLNNNLDQQNVYRLNQMKTTIAAFENKKLEISEVCYKGSPVIQLIHQKKLVKDKIGKKVSAHQFLDLNLESQTVRELLNAKRKNLNQRAGTQPNNITDIIIGNRVKTLMTERTITRSNQEDQIVHYSQSQSSRKLKKYQNVLKL